MSWKQAEANARLFLRDIGLPCTGFVVDGHAGWYGLFRLYRHREDRKGPRFINVGISGRRLEDWHRRKCKPGQGICDYPRVYIGGTPYLWVSAVENARWALTWPDEGYKSELFSSLNRRSRGDRSDKLARKVFAYAAGRLAGGFTEGELMRIDRFAKINIK